jgi:riboflavin synthase
MVRLGVATGKWAYGRNAGVGDSVSVAGVCLTVVKKVAWGLEFDVVAETLAKTRLGELAVGDRVNLEHAATAATFLGGHIVQGHVDGVGVVKRVESGDDWRVWVDVPAEMRAWLVSKGSVCVEGVSLTVAGVTGKGFWVALIPETLSKTTLSALEVGGEVNVECDVIGKMVQRQMQSLAEARRPRRKAKKH